MAFLFAESEFSSLPTRCLQPEVSMSPLAFLNSSCQLAQHLGLQLPLVAGEALLLRQVQELALPQVRAKAIAFWDRIAALLLTS